MSKQDIERFSADLRNKADMAAEVKKLGKNLGAIVKLAGEKGYNFTEKELKNYAKAKKGELTAEQLEKVAGGAAVVAVHVAVVG